MSLRRLWVLVSHLPQDSAVARVHHGEAAEWQIGDYLLARIANTLYQANSSKRVPDSQLIKPPGPSAASPVIQPRRAIGTAADLDAMFTRG